MHHHPFVTDWSSGAAILAAILVVSSAAAQLPNGPSVQVGTVDHSVNGRTMTIEQHSRHGIVNYQSFGIGADNTVTISLPSDDARYLARVVGNDVSRIFGSLNSPRGTVVLTNPAGIFFGRNAKVDVAHLVASTLDITDADFLTDQLTFHGDGGLIVNLGDITAETVALLGESVINAGSISADSVALGAGRDAVVQHRVLDGRVTIDFSEMTVPEALVVNDGNIRAGSWATKNTLQLVSAGSVVTGTQSELDAGGDVTITGGSGVVDVAGDITSRSGSVRISSGGALFAAAAIKAVDDVELTAVQSVLGENRLVSGRGMVRVNAGAAVTFDGAIAALSGVIVDAAASVFLDGKIETEADIVVNYGREILLESTLPEMEQVVVNGRVLGGTIHLGGGGVFHAFNTATGVSVVASGWGESGLYTGAEWSSGPVLFRGDYDWCSLSALYRQRQNVSDDWAGVTWDSVNWDVLRLIRVNGAGVALPTNPTVIHGDVDHDYSNAGILEISQSTSDGIVNYDSFDIGEGGLVDVNLPGASSRFLARVVAGGESEILGTLQADRGRVFLVNPAGIVFGDSAHVDVSNLVAATMRVSDDDFLDRSVSWTGGHGSDISISGSFEGSLEFIAAGILDVMFAEFDSCGVVFDAGSHVLIEDSTFEGAVDIVAGHDVVVDGGFVNISRITAGGRVAVESLDDLTVGDIRAGAAVELEAHDSLTVGDISAAAIELKGDGVSAGVLESETVAITSTDRVSVSRITTDSSIIIDATTGVSVSGDLRAGGGDVAVLSGSSVRMNGDVSAGGAILIQSTGLVTVTGDIVATGGDVHVESGASVRVDRAVSAAGSVTVEADGDVDLKRGVTSDADGILIDADGAMTGYDDIRAAGSITVRAGGPLSVYGKVETVDETIHLSSGDAVALFQSIHAGGDILLESAGELDLYADVRSQHSAIDVAAGEALNLYDVLDAHQSIGIRGGDIRLLGGLTSHSSSVDVVASGDLMAHSRTIAGDDISLRAGGSFTGAGESISRNGSVIIAAGKSTAVTGELSAAVDVRLSAGGDLRHDGIIAEGARNVDILSVSGDVILSRTIGAHGDLRIEAGERIFIDSELHSLQGSIDLVATNGTINLAAPIAGGDIVNVNSAPLVNAFSDLSDFSTRSGLLLGNTISANFAEVRVADTSVADIARNIAQLRRAESRVKSGDAVVYRAMQFPSDSHPVKRVPKIVIDFDTYEGSN